MGLGKWLKWVWNQEDEGEPQRMPATKNITKMMQVFEEESAKRKANPGRDRKMSGIIGRSLVVSEDTYAAQVAELTDEERAGLNFAEIGNLYIMSQAEIDRFRLGMVAISESI